MEQRREAEKEGANMDMLPYVDSLIKEYFLFRGFNQTFYAFETECESDKFKVFNVEESVQLLLDTFLPNYQSKRLVSLCQFLESNIFSKLEPDLQKSFKRITASIYKKYIVHALQNKRTDKVTELFERVANRLRQQPEEWSPWFSIQYVKNPERHPEFEVYFTKEWSDNLRTSLENLLSKAFHKVPLPSILRFHLDRLYRRNLQLRIEALEVEKARLETLLSIQNDEDYHHQLELRHSRESRPRREEEEDREGDEIREMNGNTTEDADPSTTPSNGVHEEAAPKASQVQLENLPTDMVDALSDLCATDQSPSALTKTASSASSSTAKSLDDGPPAQILPSEDTSGSESVPAALGSSSPEEVEVLLHSGFEGHEAPITCCRYSPDGENVASASTNGTVRIWSADDATPSNRNVTIRTNCRVICLDWEPRREKLVLFGTSLGTVKGWNVDSKRFVFDVSVSQDQSDIIGVKCSPSDPIFVVVASTSERGEGRKGSLTLWNSRTFSKIGRLSAERDADLESPVNCAAFSRCGRTIAAGSEDGMITTYEASSRSVTAGFPASGDAAIVDIKFANGDDSLWTLSAAGRAQEWRLATSEVLREVDLLSLGGGRANPRAESAYHELVIDPSGTFLASSLGKRGVILRLEEGSVATAAVESDLDSLISLDWHPTCCQFVAGSQETTVIHIYSVIST